MKIPAHSHNTCMKDANKYPNGVIQFHGILEQNQNAKQTCKNSKLTHNGSKLNLLKLSIITLWTLSIQMSCPRDPKYNIDKLMPKTLESPKIWRFQR